MELSTIWMTSLKDFSGADLTDEDLVKVSQISLEDTFFYQDSTRAIYSKLSDGGICT